MNNNRTLFEGLRKDDLINLVEPLFYIDMHKSKMGEDRDVCVLSFSVKDRLPAKDMMEFIEKGHSYVLDADISSGEDKDGKYTVFVELERKDKLHNQIKEIVNGLKRLTGIEEWTFRYHKSFNSHSLFEDPIESVIPSNPRDYDGLLTKIKTESIKKFFNKTLMDDLTLENDIITIHKPFSKKIQLRWIKENDPQAMIEGTVDMSTDSTAEIFWLTKVLGDYNISKFDDKLLFVNGDRAMLLQRI